MHAQLFCERDDALTRIVYARLENSEFSIPETVLQSTIVLYQTIDSVELLYYLLLLIATVG